MTLCIKLRVKKNGYTIKNIDHKIKCVQGQKLWFQYWNIHKYIWPPPSSNTCVSG